MKIRCRQVAQSLETLQSRLRPILGDDGPRVLKEAKSGLLVSKDQYDLGQRNTWGFRIDPPRPLVFRTTTTRRITVRTDLSTFIYWDREPAPAPVKLGVLLRVWSLDEGVYFRPQWDAQTTVDRIDPDKGRVLLRLHFDLANPKQQGPKYHMQVGGNAQDDEVHWFPQVLSVPRLVHMPVDLTLATELVAATFYPDEYKRFRREASWKSSRQVSQAHLLHSYFKEGLASIDKKKSLLDTLWNVRWNS